MGTVKHLTQGQRAKMARSRLRALVPELDGVFVELREVVGLAQNPPPEGDRDGTLVDPEWSRCRNIKDALRKLMEIL
jgi:hypothetical protein